MLSIFGVLGILFAGVAADALLSHPTKADDDSDDLPDDGAGEDTNGLDGGAGDLLDDPEEDAEGNPVSDDLPDPQDAAVSLQGGEGNDLMSGGGAADTLSGGAGDDQIDAKGGADTIDAGSGNDMVWAGAEDDDISGGFGDDTLYGQAGDDVVTGDFGADLLFGHEGDDTLSGGAGADTLMGGMGGDELFGGSDGDWLAGGEGDDSLFGGAGSDILDGNAGDDQLSGLDGAQDDGQTDYLNGGTGNDVLTLGMGDHGMGGDCEDSFVVQEWLAEGNVARIADYDFVQDQIVVVYDSTAHPDPQLSLATKSDGDDVTILLDGAPVAVVTGGSSVFLSDIRLSAA